MALRDIVSKLRIDVDDGAVARARQAFRDIADSGKETAESLAVSFNAAIAGIIAGIEVINQAIEQYKGYARTEEENILGTARLQRQFGLEDQGQAGFAFTQGIEILAEQADGTGREVIDAIENAQARARAAIGGPGRDPSAEDALFFQQLNLDPWAVAGQTRSQAALSLSQAAYRTDFGAEGISEAAQAVYGPSADQELLQELGRYIAQGQDPLQVGARAGVPTDIPGLRQRALDAGVETRYQENLGGIGNLALEGLDLEVLGTNIGQIVSAPFTLGANTAFAAGVNAPGVGPQNITVVNIEGSVRSEADIMTILSGVAAERDNDRPTDFSRYEE